MASRRQLMAALVQEWADAAHVLVVFFPVRPPVILAPAMHARWEELRLGRPKMQVVGYNGRCIDELFL